jgi:hypothetical protein
MVGVVWWIWLCEPGSWWSGGFDTLAPVRKLVGGKVASGRSVTL